MAFYQAKSKGNIILGYKVGVCYQYLTRDENIKMPDLDLQLIIDDTGIDETNPYSSYSTKPLELDSLMTI